MLLLLLVNFVSGFRLALMCISLIESISSSITHFHVFQLLALLPQFIEMTFFHWCRKDKSSQSKLRFRLGNNRCKRVLEAAKLAYANKTKESITSQKLGSWDFWRIANSVLKKSKSAIRFHWWSLCLRMSGKG